MDRFATFSFATALTVAACGGIDDGSTAGRGLDGDPAPDAALRDSGFGSDAGGIMPSYGGGRFSPDAGVVTDGGKADSGSKLDAGTVDDDGGNIAMYGLPWPDGGWDVNVQPPYGLPPLDGGTDDPGDDGEPN